MDYVGTVNGSPLIPQAIIYGHTLFLLLSLLGVSFSRKILPAVFALHITLLFLGALAVGFVLIPAPVITKAYRDESAISIVFDHPVQRRMLQKTISPEIAGVWAFEDPVYSTHLYRTLVFYPLERFEPGAAYTITLAEVANFLQQFPHGSFTVRLPADIASHESAVLGIEHDTSVEKVAVTGIFPRDTWTNIGVDQPVRVEFNQEVVHESAQTRLIISPVIDGNFDWEGTTMEFRPKDAWVFTTPYTVYIAPGIQSVSGLHSTYGYRITFTTQEPVTKLAVPAYLQQYALSCEAAALRMALSYRGISVTEDELLGKIGTDPTVKNGSTWGNPYVGFVGNVRGKQMVSGYGVYWEPIARAARGYRPAESFTGWTISLLTESIQRNHPVIIWGYVNSGQPLVWYTPGGDKINAVADEHTVLVVGYVGSPSNPTSIIVNDPRLGEVYWSREHFEKKWKAFNQSGVLVY